MDLSAIDVDHSKCSVCGHVYRAGPPGRPRACPRAECRGLPNYQKPTIGEVEAYHAAAPAEERCPHGERLPCAQCAANARWNAAAARGPMIFTAAEQRGG